MIDLSKGMVTSQLSEEELQRYRSIPPPKKQSAASLWTTAPRDKKRGTVLCTSKSYLSTRETKVRK